MIQQMFYLYFGTKALKKLAEGLTLVSYKKELLDEAAVLSEEAATLDVIPNITGKDGLFGRFLRIASIFHPILTKK